MGVKEKGKSLKLVFFKYLISVALVVALAVGLAFLGLNALVDRGLILPANEIEARILENKEALAEKTPFDEKFLPEGAGYVLLSKEGAVLQSNMPEPDRAKALEFHRGERVNTPKLSYININRPEGDLVIRYQLKSHYGSPWMESYLPGSNVLFFLVILLLCLLGSLGVTLVWAKKLTGQLQLMTRAADQIAGKDLDFAIQYSNIKEFNRVLQALDQMKEALSRSLKAQWAQEERRKNQISALAHDLKTPLSIVKGNAELLKEGDLSEEEARYVDYILKNTDRIADYARALMVVNQSENLEEVRLEKTRARDLADQILTWTREITALNELDLKVRLDLEEGFVYVDKPLFQRALQNILMNALDYGPDRGQIDLNIKTGGNYFQVEVLDQGPGFTPGDLAHSKEAFYRGDRSRQSAKNYGLGLYVAAQILKGHKGSLYLKNRKDRKGALVSLRLPFIGKSA